MKQPTHDKPTPTPSLKGGGEGGADNQTSGSPTGANDSAFNGESGQPRGANAAKRQSFSEGAEREWEPYKYPSSNARVQTYPGTPTGANDSASDGESGQPRGANAAKRQSFSEGAEREWEPYKYWDPFVERGDVEASPEM